MYEIILKTWYQETPNKRYDEVYNNLGFENIEEAVKYLNDNLEIILDGFPVDGELTIKYNTEHNSEQLNLYIVSKLYAHEYWYYFGKCTPYPHQISKGTRPRIPYKRFNTKDECQNYIDNVW